MKSEMIAISRLGLGKFKISRRLIFLALLSIFCNGFKAQSPDWIYGNKQIHFSSTTVTSTPLPQPGIDPSLHYTGQTATKGQTCQFDSNGDLLFFIIDGTIYDGQGFVIARGVQFINQLSYSEESPDQFPAINGDIAVTNVPGYCKKFYLFSVTKGSVGQTSVVVCSILDMSAQSVVFPNDANRKGCLISQAINNTILNHSFDYFFSTSFGLNITLESDTYLLLQELNGLQDDRHSMEIIEVNEHKKYLVLAGRVDGMQIFEINLDEIIQVGNCGGVNNDWGPGYDYGTVESFVLPSGFKLASSVEDCMSLNENSTNTVLFQDLSLDGEVSNPELVVLGNQEVYSNAVTSIEFSPNGQYLWFTKNNAPEIGVIQLSNYAVTFPIDGDLSEFAYSELEMQKDENGLLVIYISSANGMKKITIPNEPINSTLEEVEWDGEVFPNTMEGGTGENLIYSIQVQNTNTIIAQNYMEVGACCQDNEQTHFGSYPQVNLMNDGLWTDGSNPFGDSNSPLVITQDLIFQTGTNTNIVNMVLQFDEGADLIIEKGAKVSLNGTVLTSIQCNHRMWPGVDLLGTTNIMGTVDQNPMTGGDQGYLYMNNSIIENATKGVEIGTSALNGGGIIRAYNSTFKNNQIDVAFKKYHYTLGGNYIQNKSLFNHCTFVTDAHLNNNSAAPLYHVSLSEVDKIYFTHCSFLNTTSNGIYAWNQRGVGIYSIKSSFFVDGMNDTWSGQNEDVNHTTFYRLRYGIRSHGFNVPISFYTCRKMEFQDCLYGIVNYNTDNVQIYQNNFEIPDAANQETGQSMERGIHLTNSTGYVVEQNKFFGSNDVLVQEDYPNALGIWVDNSGDFSNEIRNNDFDEMKLGTYVTRQNRDFVAGPDGTTDPDPSDDQTGLQLFCNTYTNGQTDVYRDQNTFMRWVQGGNQGDGQPDLFAGNRFSVPDCSGATSDWVNDPYNVEHLLYICHDQPNTIPDCGFSISTHPDGNNAILMSVEEDDDVLYNEADCANTYGGGGDQTPGGIGGIIAQLNTVKVELQSAKHTYNTVVDNNQKQSTIELLNEAFPHESQYYRDLLIQRFPLSDEVMRQLIAQASRLSPWHLTEIFLANSALRKEMIAEIERAEILSPFFMTFLYDADAGSSLRTLMELNIMGLATHRDKLIQQIAQSGLTYESDPELETDQLIYLNEYMNQINQSDAVVMLRSRASLLASKGDYAGAIALVTDEPRLANYKKILEMEQVVLGDWSVLNAAQITELWSIYNLPSDFSSSMAHGILQKIGEVDFEPEPRVPIQYRSLQIGKDKLNNDLPLLGVWPNPASGSAWLHYPIEAEGNATIQVYDPQGRLMNSFQPNTHGLVELSLKNYESGIYVVQLIAFDKVVESIKLTVVNQD